MDTGLKISSVAHAGLISWALVGGVFSSSDSARPIQVAEVSLISSEDFAALMVPQATRPDPAPQPQPIAPPEPVAPDAPEPEPQPLPVAPDIAPPPVSAPTISPVPAVRPADRVAPTPAPPPPPEAEIAPDVRDAVAPEPAAQAEAVEPPQTATAPEAATTQIVTEATPTDENASAAPLTSPRPQARPQRPVQSAAAQPPAETQPAPADPPVDALADAVAAALAETLREGAPVASGPPLTGSELDGLRAAVAQCWNVGALSTEAMAVTVTVGVELDRDGRPEAGSLRMVDAQGGSGQAAQQAFEAARRAILRCGAQGFDLPAEKYDQWRDIEMTFNPESMRIR
jgi:hypothetical protein